MSKYYAYLYRDPSRGNEAIYVGKGRRERAFYHIRSRAVKKNRPFANRLAVMIRAGVEPVIELFEAIDESHAYFMEECLISVIGRKDLGTGTLLNLSDGGTGGNNKSEATLAKMRKYALSRPETHNENIRKALVGRKLSPEHAAKCGHGKTKGQHYPNLSVSIKDSWPARRLKYGPSGRPAKGA